jgi:hypothetical protein
VRRLTPAGQSADRNGFQLRVTFVLSVLLSPDFNNH